MSELAYFRRRLATTQRATELPPSTRYTLAASTLEDDALDQTVEMFGGTRAESFGFSDIIREYTSRDPRFVPVEDLSLYQQNLKDTGYLPPDYPVTGIYDDVSHAASTRAERDTNQLIRAGGHIGSVTVGKAFEYLAGVVPQSLFEAVVGTATGLVESAATTITHPVEAAEEAGVLGGAAAGAIGGFTVAGPVGALVGGVGAGILGGIADFFGDDEGEEGQSLVENIWDSLSPWDEYKESGAKNFFALLDTVMLAAGIAKAGKVAVTRTRGALASPSLAGAVPQAVGARSAAGMALPMVAQAPTRTVAQAGFREAFRRAAPGTVAPGMAGRATKWALQRPVRGGALLGGSLNAGLQVLEGDLDDVPGAFAAGAVVGGIGGKVLPGKAREAVIKGIERAPLMRIAESGAGKVTRSIYTGFAVAGTTGRLTADITPGEDPTERGIKEAKKLTESGAWDVMDLTVGTILYPSRILPIRPREIGDAMRALDNPHVLMPFYRAHATVSKQKVSQKVIDEVDAILGNGDPGDRVTVATNANRIYLDTQLTREATRLAREELGDEVSGIVGSFKLSAATQRKRAELVRNMNTEAEAGEASVTAARLFEESLETPRALQSEIENWQGRNTSLSNLMDERQAQDVLEVASTTLTEGQKFRVMPAVRGQVVTKQGLEDIKTRYDSAARRYRQAQDIAAEHRDNPLVAEQVTDAGAELDGVITELRRLDSSREWDDIVTAARPQGSPYEIEPAITKNLDEISEYALVENTEMTRILEDAGIDRYIAVNTGEDILVTADIPKLLKYEGIDQVMRHPVREFLSSIARRPDDYKDLGPMRYNSIVSSLDKTAGDLGLGLDGKQMADRIMDFVRLRSDPDWARKHLGEVLQPNRTGTVIRRTQEKTGVTRKELFKVDPRDLSLDDYAKALRLDEFDNVGDISEAADKIKRAVTVGAAWGADMHSPSTWLRQLGKGLGIEGLTTFQDFARTFRVPVHRWAPDKGFFAKAKKGSWGYVPNNLRRSHMALQFTFSPTFDASRYTEALSFGAREMIPPRLIFKRKGAIINDPDGFLDLDGNRVFGDEAIAARNRVADEIIYGRSTVQSLDDIEFRTTQAGVFGFQPREVEANQAFWIAQRYLRKGPLSPQDIDEIRERVLIINRYGKGTSALAKSAHFVFFPFLFQAKQLQLMQDVVLGAPGRTALIHEGFRRWQGVDGEPGLKEEFERVFDKYLPLAQELSRLNNLAYGIGAGRFVLEGFSDGVTADGKVALDKSTLGKITQGLTQFLAPGGIHTPVGESFGGFMEAARHFFVPVVIADDGSRVTSVDEVTGIFERLVPAYRDFERWFVEKGLTRGVAREQLAVIGGGGSSYGDFTGFLDNKRLLDQSFERVALASGASSWDSLRRSEAGAPLVAVYDRLRNDLRAKFPRGAELSTRITNTDETKAIMLNAIARQEHRTAAEEAILSLGMIEERLKDVAATAGVSQETIFKAVTPVVRAQALKLVEDRHFMNLWEQLGFSRVYGPLRVLAA